MILPYKSPPDLVSAVLRKAINLFMVLFLMVIAKKIVGFDAKNNLDSTPAGNKSLFQVSRHVSQR